MFGAAPALQGLHEHSEVGALVTVIFQMGKLRIREVE